MDKTPEFVSYNNRIWYVSRVLDDGRYYLKESAPYYRTCGAHPDRCRSATEKVAQDYFDSIAA